MFCLFCHVQLVTFSVAHQSEITAYNVHDMVSFNYSALDISFCTQYLHPFYLLSQSSLAVIHIRTGNALRADIDLRSLFKKVKRTQISLKKGRLDSEKAYLNFFHFQLRSLYTH